MEKRLMLQACRTIMKFYKNLVPPLTEQHGLRYPDGLERVVMARLETLGEIE